MTREVKRSSLPEMVLQLTVTRPGKSFCCYFSSLEHLQNYKDMIETLVENAKKAEATDKALTKFSVDRLRKELENRGYDVNVWLNPDSTGPEAKTQ